MPYLLDANVFIQAKPGVPARAARVAWWEPALWSRLLSGFLGLANRRQCLVAHALAHGHTVVTHEIASISTKKIKIPDACIGLGIKCMTPYEMLRTERARFILGPKK